VNNHSPFQLLGWLLLFIFIFLLGSVAIVYYFPSLKPDLSFQKTKSVIRKSFHEIAEPYHPQPVTLNSVFESDHTWTATLSAERTTRILATGDVLLARTVNSRTTKDNDFLWPWRQTADVLTAADLTFINLETPLPKACPVILGGFTFCGDQRHVQGLKFGGVDIINLANNHAGNYGHEGVDETVELLRSHGFLISGFDGPAYIEVKNQTFAFLGYNEVDVQPGIALADSELIAHQVAEAKTNADVVIVQFHWGNEYTYQPSANQQRLAQLAVENGADVIIGNHPHWFEALEMIDGKFITYSHGNFIFDQMWSQETREGVVGRYTFYDNQLVDVEFLPILIEDFGQPGWLEGEAKQRILDRLKTETTKLNSKSN
jgi:poly-gamma-glutamate capsule biosynthesis protein CapA/YwtB (metallophosphatase superfamily)